MALCTFFADPFFTETERILDRAVQQAVSRNDIFSPATALARTAASFRNAVDVVETKDAFKVITDTPGFAPEDIKVELHEGRLTVSGERKLERENKDADGKFHVQERHFSKFTRQFQLPANVDADQVGASLDKGVLTVTVPKVLEPPKPEPKRIQVNAAAEQ